MDWLVLAPAARRPAILDLMRSAERRLALSMFRCDDFAVLDEVAAAVKRKVQVRVLITRRARGWKRRLKELRALLASTGALVQRYTGPMMKYHAKYVVADDGPALVSSLNFTRKCFESTYDFLVFSDDPQVISGLEMLFEHDFSRPGSPLPDITDRLIVGPDQARLRFKNLLDEAKSSIRIIDHRVIDSEMVSVLRQKQNDGVLVQVLGHGSLNDLVSHGRMTLIDNRIAAIGSIHLSPPSLDSRREVAILIREPSIVDELNRFFETLALDRSNLAALLETPAAPIEDEDDENDEDDSTMDR